MTSHPRGDFPAARCFALVPCAGFGTRSGAAGPKQYEPLAGRAMVAWTLEALARVEELHATLVVLSPGDTRFAALGLEGWPTGGDRGGAGVVDGGGVTRMPPELDSPGTRWSAHVGGAARADTVAAGLDELLARGAREDDWVLVHDAARCLIRPESVQRLIAACRDDAVGGLLAMPVADTLKRSDATTDTERVSATVSRNAIWAAQTPQMFRIGALRHALREGLARTELAITDEASAIEAQGQSPLLVRGDFENLKVTWPEDFALAERLLRSRAPLHSKATP